MGRNGWFSGALLLGALSALAWFSPVADRLQSRSGRAVAAAFDTVVQPVIDAVGKGPVAAVFAASAVLLLWRGLGRGLPPLPRVAPDMSRFRRKRPEPEDSGQPEVPTQRRRDLTRLALVDEAVLAARTDLLRPNPASTGSAPGVDQPSSSNPFASERAHAEYLAACHGSDTDIAKEAMLQSYRTLLGADAELSDALYERAVALVREQQRRSTPHGLSVDPIVLARKPRERGRDWSGDRSWFGGLPRLGGAAWPTSPDGVPLPFAAQIDLAEIATVCPASPLPHEGSLAFFLNSGAVVYVPPGAHEPTPAPSTLPAAFEEGGYPFPERPSRLTKPLFPYWPVEPVALPLPAAFHDFGDEERHEEIYEAQHALLAERVPTREYAFSVYSARQAGIASADRLWWYAALHVENQLREALDSVERMVALREEWIEKARGYQVKLAAAETPDEKAIANSKVNEERHQAGIPAIRQQGANLETFVANFAGFTAGRAVWEEMTGDEIALLEDVMKEAAAQFPDLCRRHRLDDLRDLCIRRMAAGEPEALAALPEDMLAFVNHGYRLTSQSPHQMFGLAGVKQSALYEHLSDLLLLQLSYDDMTEWRFGDMGLWHFWLSPEDAAALRWDKAVLTFECS